RPVGPAVGAAMAASYSTVAAPSGKSSPPWRLPHAGLQVLPAPAVEGLQRTEPALVVHLAVALDPIAQVQVLAPVARGPFQLPQDRQRAEPATQFRWLVEGVHRRQRAAADQVGDRHRQQAMAAVLAQLEEPALGPRPDQELVELGRAVEIGTAH